MKEALTIKELIDFAYSRYKSKKAIGIDIGYIKEINYFNYRFDIYSLVRAINSKINDKKVAIISENRYEFLVTYLANIILKNTIVIIDSNLSSKAIEGIIKKYNIKTIFFSNKNKNKILEICNIKKKKLNLVNFDSNNKFPIIEYEKLINVGRYIENYSIDNIPDTEEKIKNIVIANLEGINEYSQQDLLKSAYIIGKKLKIRKKKNILADSSINTFYKTVIKMVLPLLYGLSIQFYEDDELSKKNSINIIEENKNRIMIEYRNNKYSIENINTDTYVRKVEDSLLKEGKGETSTNFILIKSNKKIKDNKKRATI